MARSTGNRCGLRAEDGYRVCRKHGSRAGRPPKHGHFSAFTGRHKERYDRWLEAVQGLSLDDHLAAMASLTERLVERSQELDTPDFRKEAVRLFNAAVSGGDPASSAAALNQLGALLRRGAREDSALRSTVESLDRFAKRMEAAKSLDLQEQHTVRIRDLDAMLASIVAILMQHGEFGEKVARQIHRDIIQPSGALRLVQ